MNKVIGGEVELAKTRIFCVISRQGVVCIGGEC